MASAGPGFNPLVRNIIRTFSTQVGCQLISILAGIVVARAIGPSSNGFASYALTAVSLVIVLFYGFADAVLFQFGKLRYPARAVHAVSLRIMLAALAIIVPLFVALAMFVPSQRPLAAARTCVTFRDLHADHRAVSDGARQNSPNQYADGDPSASYRGVTVALLTFTNWGLSAVLGAWILFYAIGAYQYAAGLRPILAACASDAHVPAGLFGVQARFGFRAAGVSVAGFVNMRVNVVLVSVMLSATVLGWCMLAIASDEMLWQVSRAFIWAALGRIGSDPLPAAAALVARLTCNVLAIVAILGVVAFAAGPWLIVHVQSTASLSRPPVLRFAGRRRVWSRMPQRSP